MERKNMTLAQGTKAAKKGSKVRTSSLTRYHTLLRCLGMFLLVLPTLESMLIPEKPKEHWPPSSLENLG